VSVEQTHDEYTKLVARIRECDHAYYVLGRPLVDDLSFDRLLERLKALETQHPELVGPDSPSLRVGSDLATDFPEVQHDAPVLSLDKAYDTAEILAWVKRSSAALGHRFGVVAEEKIDGLSLVLRYENGLLVRALTRGNGFVGNDVTANVRTIRDIPLRLSKAITGTFRGEVYLRKTDFEKLNQALEVPYANPRNFASGTLRRVKSSEVAQVPLRMFVYEGDWPQAPELHAELMAELGVLGFATNPRTRVLDLPNDVDALTIYIEEERVERPGLAYEIDGLVFKINESDFRQELGMTGHHPRGAIAYKFESPQGVTRVTRIDIQVGRTGRITPVARVEGVVVGGATIQNVTLHNQDYIDALELSEGDLVSVSRRGDVIPAVDTVVEKKERAPIWHMPSRCPSCDELLVKEGAHHFCPNFECPDRVRGRLYFFVGRDQMDMASLGPETVDVLLERGLVHDIPDLYTFDPYALLAVPGFGERKIQALVEGRAASLAKPYAVTLPSLGIPEIGTKVAELLIDGGYPSIDTLFELVDQGRAVELLEIKGIGPRTIEILSRELSSPAFRELVARLKACGLSFVQTAPLSKTDDSLPQVCVGQTWCVTGSFTRFKPRETSMDEVRKRGGAVVGDVSKSVTHLLAGEKAGSKLDKARKLGVAIVDEQTFFSMLGL